MKNKGTECTIVEIVSDIMNYHPLPYFSLRTHW
jgi:hypothetical protein